MQSTNIYWGFNMGKEEVNKTYNDELQEKISSGKIRMDLLFGVRDVAFYHKDFKVNFSLTNLPGNCGVILLFDVRVDYLGERAKYFKEQWDADYLKGERVSSVSVDDAIDLYKNFLTFLKGCSFNSKRTLFFTDAIGGEKGKDVLSLWDMAHRLKIPMSSPTYNNNSGRSIFNCWVQLDVDLPMILKEENKLRKEVIEELTSLIRIDINNLPSRSFLSPIGILHV
jgi:hypothetical protein